MFASIILVSKEYRITHYKRLPDSDSDSGQPATAATSPSREGYKSLVKTRIRNLQYGPRKRGWVRERFPFMRNGFKISEAGQPKFFRALFSAPARRRFKSLFNFFTSLQQTQKTLFAYLFFINVLLYGYNM